MGSLERIDACFEGAVRLRNIQFCTFMAHSRPMKLDPPVDPSRDHILGNPEAELTLVDTAITRASPAMPRTK